MTEEQTNNNNRANYTEIKVDFPNRISGTFVAARPGVEMTLRQDPPEDDGEAEPLELSVLIPWEYYYRMRSRLVVPAEIYRREIATKVGKLRKEEQEASA